MRRQAHPDFGSFTYHLLKHRKAVISLLVFLVIGLLLFSCDWNMLGKAIPAGYIRKEEHIDPSGWQDEGDARYHVVSDAELAEIIGYYEDFSEWMRVSNRLDEFDFDTACINAGDYCLIDDMEGRPIGENSYEKYENYNLYYFDRETLTLYYMRSNI